MFRCCSWHVFRSELLTSSSIFDIPNQLLNSTDNITHEFQKVEIQAVTQHAVVREALKRADRPQDRQKRSREILPEPRVQSLLIFWPEGRFRIMSEELYLLLWVIKAVGSFPDHHCDH
jgi:hypothetical protein